MSQALDIAVDWDGQRVTGASATIRRLSGAALLVGRSAAEVIEWVPRLYSLCGKAQTVAARLALAAARREPFGEDPAAARSLAAERAQEHLWRLLRDWPPLLAVASRDVDLAGWFRRLTGADAALGSDLASYIEKTLLGMPAGLWLEMQRRDDLAAWTRSSSAHVALLAAPLLHDASAAGAVACLDPGLHAGDFAAGAWDADYARFPVWHGAPAETGVYARWRGHPLVRLGGEGLLARLLARVVDLIVVARQLAQGDQRTPLADAATVAENVGVARVDTARGTLLHRVELSGDQVASYTVVAPTEWNFHPRGAFVSAAARLTGSNADALRRVLSRWVVAYDPCVDWSVELRRA
jgi:hypothetical protein